MSPKLTEKEIKLFNILHDSQIEDARTFNKPKYAMYWTSIVDKYKEKAHFVYELLQNADDAHASEAKFELKKDKLIFRHNGSIGFSVTADDDKKHKGHINAITGIGWSTKDKDTEKIGKFGVGFKAVFQYTKEPEIYDDKFWFKIENYVVPTWLSSDFPGRNDGETVFVFPFTEPRNAYKDITKRLLSLDNPILFLRHLQKVTINIPNESEIVYSKEIVESEKKSGITHELMKVNNNSELQNIHLFTKAINVTYKGQNSVQNISVGYLVYKNGNIKYQGRFKVFCFFPTEEDFGLKCIVHAPFILVDSRQAIKDDDVNEQLKKELAELAADALLILRDYGIKHDHLLINENIFHIIPDLEEDEDLYGEEIENPFRDKYVEKISDDKLLLSRDNKYISSDDALICRPISLMNIISNSQLDELYKKRDQDWWEDHHRRYFLAESIQKIYNQEYVESVLDELEIQTFDGGFLANNITSSFMQKQGFAWAKRLYSHLRNEEVGLYKRINNKSDITKTPFCLSPIILTSKGEWIAPYQKTGEVNVYLPISSAAEEYTIVSPEYSKSNDLKSFLNDLGLKQPDEWDHIQNVILPKYDKRPIYKDHLVDDIEVIYDYISKLKGTERRAKLSIIRQHILILCNDSYVIKPNDVIDDIDWLKSYFGDSKYFVDYKFYHKFISKYSSQIFKEFLIELGMQDSPKIEEEETHWISYDERQRFGIGNCTGGKIVDYKLSGFDDWDNIDLKTSKSLWEWLANNISQLESFKQAECRYQYYQYYTRHATSTLMNSFYKKEWLFNAEGELSSISDIHIEDLEANEYLLDDDLINFFGIESATKSLEELGASKSQIAQNELGQMAEAMGLNTVDKLQEAFAALKEKREREQAVRQSRNQSKSSNSRNKINIADEDEASFHGKQRNTNLDELSANSISYNSTHQIKTNQNIDEKVNDITQKLEDEANKKIEEEKKRAGVNSLVKYSKEWFDTLLDLEYNNIASDTEYSRNSVKITFSRFRKESGSEQVYILSNPSRSIPIWIEEVSGLTVKFTFFNRDDLSLTFDVANVKDFNLRVKPKSADIQALDSIDWTRCVKAVIEVNSPSQIVGRLKNAFKNLPFEEDYNFKEHFTNRLSFVFGPPGTGKTTRLAEIIKDKMRKDKCKILVLAPTNKACDVLTKKIVENDDYYSWLGRFVATGDEYIENSNVLIDRSQDISKQKKCCVVSTIARLPYDGFTETTEGKLLKDINWDYVVVDEASMIPLVQIVYAIYKLTSSKFIIAGDPMQISPIVKESGWVGENIFTMVKLDDFEKATTEPIQFQVERLTTQYRSVPSIGNLYSNYCYDGKLINARKDKDLREISMGNLSVKPVTFIPFRVERYDSIFGVKRLQGSNVHIYSALFTVETCVYIAKKQKTSIRIGIICPYAPQAQLINKLIEQRSDIPANVEVLVGTIHGFQGDQCDIIMAVFNPPKGIGVAPDRIMLNNRNVLNVAISRASDYLFVLLPHPDSYGYSNLIEINKLAAIVKKNVKYKAVINSDDIEECIFGSKNYIESNTFVTNHQVANVYTKPACLYEVRIDDNAVDIQVGDNSNFKDQYSTENENESLVSDKLVEENYNNDEQLSLDASGDIKSNNYVTKETLEDEIKDAINQSKQYQSPEMYTQLFKKYRIDLQDALDIVINNHTKTSIYIAFLIVGSNKYRNELGWREAEKNDLVSRKSAIRKMKNGHVFYMWLLSALAQRKFPIKGINRDAIDNISYNSFVEALELQKKRQESKQYRREQSKRDKRAHNDARNVGKTPYYYSRHESQEREEDKLYNKFDFGLSDWD